MKQDYSQICGRRGCENLKCDWLFSVLPERTLWFQRQPCYSWTTKWCFELASHYFNWGLSLLATRGAEPCIKADIFSTLVWQNMNSRKATPPVSATFESLFRSQCWVEFQFSFLPRCQFVLPKPTSLNTCKSQLQFSWFSKLPFYSASACKRLWPQLQLAPLSDGLRW